MLKEMCAVLLYSLGSGLYAIGTSFAFFGCFIEAVFGLPVQLFGNYLRRTSGKLVGQDIEDLGPHLRK